MLCYPQHNLQFGSKLNMLLFVASGYANISLYQSVYTLKQTSFPLEKGNIGITTERKRPILLQ